MNESVIAATQPPVNAITKRTVGANLYFLDGLRGIAAAIVMIGHARWLLWEGYSHGFAQHPEQYSFIEKILVYCLSIFHYGHHAVLFFFVLSGFVIHLKYSANLKKDISFSFDLRNYLVRRIKRVYPPFLFVLLLTWVLDSYGTHMGYTIYFNQTPNDIINASVYNDHSFINLLGNLFFLKNDSVGVWGTNGPLWSLKYEWWFYILYPCLLLVNRKSVYKSLLLVLFLFTVSFFVQFHSFAFGISVCQYLLCWWLGCLLADIYTKRIAISYLLFAWLTILIPLLMLFESRIHSELVEDICWAFGFFGMLNFLFFIREKNFSFRFLNRLRWLGECSYTLYIIHFPVLVLFNGILLHYTGNVMPRSMIFVFAAVVICTALAWALHFIIEKPFTRKRTA